MNEDDRETLTQIRDFVDGSGNLGPRFSVHDLARMLLDMDERIQELEKWRLHQMMPSLWREA